MITKLKKELVSDTYNGMTDASVVERLNAEITVPVEYMLTDVRLAAIIGTVKAVAVLDAFKANLDSVSGWIVDKLMSTGLDIGNSETLAFVAPLVAGGIVTQNEADEILAFGQTTTTRAKQIGFVEPVKLVFVEEARR